MKSLLSLLLLTGLFPLFSFAPTPGILTPKEKRQYALALLQEYNPEGQFIIKMVDTLAFNNAFDRYAEGHTEQAVRDALGTMVHESHHGYSALLAWRLRPKEMDKFACPYLGDGESLLVPFTEVFPTEEMGKTVPAHLRTQRFKTYVYNPGGKIQLSSNVLGIYGLLDEWIAYYHGTVTDVNMYRWYQQHTEGTANDWYHYFSTVGSVINAHVEFKFFCLSYLLYAQKNKPAIYKELMANEEFIRTFLHVNRQYGSLVKSYGGIKKNILSNLRSRGLNVSEDDEWIYLSRQAVGNFANEYKMLENELKKPAYQALLGQIQALAKPAGSAGK